MISREKLLLALAKPLADSPDDIQSAETFDTALGARSYLHMQGLSNPTWDLRRHKVVPVRVTISRTDLKPEAPTP